MQLRIKPRQRRRRAPQQIDLFAGERHNSISDMPGWSMLPTDIQAKLTSLIRRLILDHADAKRIGLMAEIDDHL
jgi:hypothetical protein